MKINDLNLKKQANEILKIAQNHGVEQNFFFITTFQRYQMQIDILNNLEKAINENDVFITKEYVKGRENVYIHPAIRDYNRTTDSANKTIAVLMKIITTLRDKNTVTGEDHLLTFLQGGKK